MAGFSVSAMTFGTLFCINSHCSRPPSCGKRASRCAAVSSDVLKLFISMNMGTAPPVCSRSRSTCRAIKSKNVSSPRTGSSDFAFSNPMPVPRPPFSLISTVCFSSSDARAAAGASSASAFGKSSAGRIVSSEIIPVAPARNAM